MKMRTPKYQFFSNDEYKQRMDALRARMEQKGVDCMLITTPENLLYMTGYQTPGYYWWQTFIVPTEDNHEPVFIARLIESSNVEPLTWVEDSRPYQDYEDWITHTRDALASMGLDKKRIGLENDSYFLTHKNAMRLMTVLPDATFVDCSGLVEEGRVIKSPQEIEYIRQASRAAEAGMVAAIDAVKVGVTENDVAAAMHSAQILAGSEYTGLPAFIKSGPRDILTHGTWYRRRLEDKEIIHFEIPGCIHRYHSAMFRPVYLGEPSPQMTRAAQVGMDALQAGKDAIRPGVKAGDVHEVVEKTLMEGLGVTKPSRAAYSIGLAYAPDWGEGHILSMTKGEQRPLEVGMTFHLVAGTGIVPGVGGLNTTDTILVTENGCETLTDGVERKLYVR